MKKIILIGLLLLVILSLSAVSAEDNSTDTDGITQIASDEILSEDTPVKENLTPTMSFEEEVAKHAPLNDHYYLTIDGITNDEYGAVKIYVDEDYHGDYYPYGMGYELAAWEYPLGDHIITAKFNGSEKYNPFSINTTFRVVDVKITIPDEFIVDVDEYVVVLVSGDVTGTVTVYVNGTKYKTVNLANDPNREYGTAIDVTGLEYGTYNMTVVYSGDKKYPNASKSKVVNVTYCVQVLGDVQKYKNGATTDIYLPKEVSKNPIVTVENRTYAVEKIPNQDYDNQCGFSVNLSHLKPGIHMMNVTYPGDDKFPKRTIIIPLEIYAEIDFKTTFAYNESGYVSLMLPEDANGNLTVEINGQIYKSLPAAGGACINLTNFATGQYYIRYGYSGNDYSLESAYTQLDVTPIYKYPSKMTYGDNEYCIVDVGLNINGTLKYGDDDEKMIETQITNGITRFSLSKMDYEDYGMEKMIFLEYQGYDNQTCQGHFDIRIDPKPSRLAGAQDITMYYGDSKTFSVKVWGGHGKVVGKGEDVFIKIGTKGYWASTDKNGIAKVKITQVPGKYTITAKYRNAKITKTLNVRQVLSLKAVTVKKSAKKLTLQATLKKGKTPLKYKKITFKFNGKTYNAKTDSKGIAKLIIKSAVLKKLKAGKKVTYQATYLKDTVKKTATVKK